MTSDGTHMRVGEIIRAWRNHREITMRDAAKMIGISAASLCRLEAGMHTPDGVTILKLQRWLFDSK